MAKNRKTMSVAIRFGPAIKALLICSLFVVSGVGYVWQKSLIADLSLQIKTRESDLAKFEQQNKKLSEHLAGLRSPEMLMARLRELHLGLEMPASAQVWRLAEPVGSVALPVPASRQFAARP